MITEEKKLEKVENEAVDLKTAGKYYYGLGRRKTATAKMRIYFDCPKELKNKALINGIAIKDYFSSSVEMFNIYKPLEIVGVNQKDVFISIKAEGGGKTSQSGAARLAMSRALMNKDADCRSLLKSVGFLTRDPRMRERKKPGLRRARRAPQWTKR
ncbi:30S ribosomal protein S9 [bacterium]|nr:MAG: 30S ribosomal protein S9 [bacterium]